MTQLYIDDELLSLCVPRAEQLMLAEIPPEQTLQHHFSRHFRRKMRALCRYERRSPRMRQFVHRAKTAAAACAVIIVVLMSAVMSVEAARKQFFEVITKVYERFTEIRVHDPENSSQVLTLCKPEYVPNGYVIKEQHVYSDSVYDVYYVNENENPINYSQEILGGTYIFDTEDAYTDTRMIGGWEVHVIEKNGHSQMYWYDDSFFYTLRGKIELRELVKMAESIIIN